MALDMYQKAMYKGTGFRYFNKHKKTLLLIRKQARKVWGIYPEKLKLT